MSPLRKNSKRAWVIGLPGAVLAAIVLGSEPPAFGQANEAKPRQAEPDKKGGAVLCAWAIYLSIRTQSEACSLQREPIDDAIDEAIAAIDEFIVANSSEHPTQATLEAFKRRAAGSELNALSRTGLQKVCDGPDLKHFRSIDPAQLRASVKDLLAVPREPVMNPCL